MINQLIERNSYIKLNQSHIVDMYLLPSPCNPPTSCSMFKLNLNNTNKKYMNNKIKQACIISFISALLFRSQFSYKQSQAIQMHDKLSVIPELLCRHRFQNPNEMQLIQTW